MLPLFSRFRRSIEVLPASLRTLSPQAGLLLTLVAASATASATPITYTLSGNFTGTLGALQLSGPTTFSLTSNTADVQGTPGYTTNTAGISTISADGVTAVFLSPTFGVEAEYFSAAFEDTSATSTFGANAFSYDVPLDILTTVGASYTGDYLSLLNGSTPTSLGALTITGVTGQTTFTTGSPASVAVTPEPSSLLLLGTGAVTAGTLLRRRLHSA